MSFSLLTDAREMWQRRAKDAPEKPLDFYLEIHKKVLRFFQAGDYYYFIFNAKTADFDYISPEVEQVLGYPAEAVDVQLILSNIHPDDQSWFLNFEQAVTEFFAELPEEKVPNYKIRYDFRVRKSNGEYIRLLNQVVIIDYDKTFGVLRSLGVHTDITHLKTEGLPVLSFVGLNGETSITNVTTKKLYPAAAPVLSPREIQILSLLFDGMSTKQISQQLFLSIETVKTHRRNMMRKTETNNVAALLAVAVKNGWL